MPSLRIAAAGNRFRLRGRSCAWRGPCAGDCSCSSGLWTFAVVVAVGRAGAVAAACVGRGRRGPPAASRPTPAVTNPVASTPAAIIVSFVKIMVRISPFASWVIEAGTIPAVIALPAARFIAALIVDSASPPGMAADAVSGPSIAPAQAAGRTIPGGSGEPGAAPGLATGGR